MAAVIVSSGRKLSSVHNNILSCGQVHSTKHIHRCPTPYWRAISGLSPADVIGPILHVLRVKPGGYCIRLAPFTLG